MILDELKIEIECLAESMSIGDSKGYEYVKTQLDKWDEVGLSLLKRVSKIRQNQPNSIEAAQALERVFGIGSIIKLLREGNEQAMTNSFYARSLGRGW